MKPTVAVNLDGVLAQYDGWKGVDHIGDPIPGAQEFVAALREMYFVTIHTTRLNPTAGSDKKGYSVSELMGKVRAWLDQHGFEYDRIFAGTGKPLAVAYIDDRAVACQPQQYFGNQNIKHHYEAVVQRLKGGYYQHEWGKDQAAKQTEEGGA